MTEQAATKIDALTVIIPVTERHDPLDSLIGEYHAALSETASDLRYVVILDGDYPEGRKELERAAEVGLNMALYQMSRSFGESSALSVGFDAAETELILTLPAYRQVDSSQLPQVIDAIAACDMVTVRRWPRVDSQLNQWMTRAFHAFIRWITRYNFRDLGCGVRLLRKRVTDEVRLYGDQHRFLPMLAAHRGFDVREKSINQSKSESRYRLYAPAVYFRRILDVLTVFFLSRFTKKPLRLFGIVGGSLLILGGLSLAVIVVQRIVFGVELGDRPALVLATLMVVLGAQLIALGLVGELVIFANSKNDKEYTVAERINIGE